MVSLGIDPGKAGALALLARDRVELVPTPLLVAGTRNGKRLGRDEYDLVAIRNLLESWVSNYGPGALLVTVEKSQPLPPSVPGGPIANFQRGIGRAWEWMLVALEIPYQLVAPRSWQSAMHAGTPGEDTKLRSILAAQRLFPTVSLLRTPRSRKPDDGMAEALLIAEYGRRLRTGEARKAS